MGWYVKCIIAHWKAEGDSGGPRRNERMLRLFKPELVAAFPTVGQPNVGTNHMMRIAREAGVEVRIGSGA